MASVISQSNKKSTVQQMTVEQLSGTLVMDMSRYQYNVLPNDFALVQCLRSLISLDDADADKQDERNFTP